MSSLKNVAIGYHLIFWLGETCGNSAICSAASYNAHGVEDTDNAQVHIEWWLIKASFFFKTLLQLRKPLRQYTLTNALDEADLQLLEQRIAVRA